MNALSKRMGCAGLAAVLAVGCSQREDAQPVKAPPVATAAVVAVDLEERIEASGELEARYHSFVAAEVSGQITQIVTDEGEPVAAGEPVLEIDPQRRELELRAARARAAQADAGAVEARRQTERIRRLHESNAASQSKLDEAETALLVAQSDAAAQQAQLGVAEQALDDATVRAPFDGVVGQRLVSEGDFVQIGMPLVELRFPGSDPARLPRGRGRLGPRRGRPEGERARGSPSRRGLRSDRRCRLPDHRPREPNAPREGGPGESRRPAATGPLRARGSRHPGPQRRFHGARGVRPPALRRRRGLPRRRGERVERRVVTVGEFRDGMVEIRSGLDAGDVVVTRGHSELVDGAVVRVTTSGDRVLRLAKRAGAPLVGRP